MLLKLRERMGREEGFTLVELLVVMLILGLLAAIAIPSFFNQRDKARDADAKADARTAQTAMETFATDNQGLYTPTPNGAALHAIEATIPATGTSVVSTADTYTVTTTSATGNTFSISRAADGTTDSECTTHGQDGCPTNGNWAG